jgi:hypothetical protein
MSARERKMNFAVLLVVLSGLAATAHSEEAHQIPLDHIWGHDLPGTRDVRDLEQKADPTIPVDELARRLDVWKILKTLNQRPKEGEKSRNAFVVVGKGADALKNAAKVFSDKRLQVNNFQLNTELSLVWFAHMCGRYVRLVSVERSQYLIDVKYQFVSHQTAEMTTHFAIIPLGQLTEGTYQVKIQQLEPIDERGRPAGRLRDPKRIVSNSFSFVVRPE